MPRPVTQQQKSDHEPPEVDNTPWAPASLSACVDSGGFYLGSGLDCFPWPQVSLYALQKLSRHLRSLSLSVSLSAHVASMSVDVRNIEEYTD